jgi:hypothetical protein
VEVLYYSIKGFISLIEERLEIIAGRKKNQVDEPMLGLLAKMSVIDFP